MAFDFPASPIIGQTYTPAGGPTYTWDGFTWGDSNPLPLTLPSSVIISRQVISGSVANLVTTVPAGYDWFTYQIIGLKAAANQNPYIQVSRDGTNYDTGSSYTYGIIGNTATDGTAGTLAATTTNFSLAPAAPDFTSSGIALSGKLEFFPGNAAALIGMHGTLMAGAYSSSRARISNFFFYLGLSGRVQKLRLQCASTNLTAGQIILHGVPS